MTFFALLVKEMRLRMRRERTVWILVAYIVMLGSLGWLTIFSNGRLNNGYGNNPLEDIGTTLYTILIFLQLLLILFITPAFTATAINGEKERQTYDLLLCSRLSAFDLVSGKLLAGLTNTFLLIIASVPLFSLVFFFGGVSPTQLLCALLVISISALFAATFGLLCSTLVPRPAVSTAIAYMLTLLWLLLPLLLTALFPSNAVQQTTIRSQQAGVVTQSSVSLPQPWLIWNPLYAIYSTYHQSGNNTYIIGPLQLAPWVAYSILTIMITIGLFLLSLWLVKPFSQRRFKKNVRHLETGATTVA